MLLALGLIFWLSLFCMAHSYVLYPMLLTVLAKGKKINHLVYSRSEDLPIVSIMMAVYNEEKVLEGKLNSIFESNYPLDRLELIIGSDSSTDNTHNILQQFQHQYPQLQFHVFDRQGKANILNQLEPLASGAVYVFTDANVLFSKNLLFELVKHFKNPEIGQVGALFSNQGMKKEGIGAQEKGYIKRESLIKYQEGIVWGTMIGAFGGCYAINAQCFTPNPPKFFMEDFYLSMHVLSLGKKAILEPKALVFEDVPNKVSEEFKRKIRISIGNFQNLGAYASLLFPPYKGLGFSFLSHKVLRWLGPFFIAFTLISAGILGFLGNYLIYKLLFLLEMAALIGVPLLDALLRKLNINILVLRYIAYFNAMNLALLTGFFKYLKGVKSNVWQPTKRNVNKKA